MQIGVVAQFSHIPSYQLNDDFMGGGCVNKDELKIGDLIKFHNWAVGGFLFGVIVPYKDEWYQKDVCIWRPRRLYSLCESDGISVINNNNDIKDHEIRELNDLLTEIKRNNISCNYVMS